MQKYAKSDFHISERSHMTDAPSPHPSRSALSPAARSLRLQRIFARLQDGAGYADIAAEEGFSRERLRQIVRAATAPGRGYDGPDHKRMQMARLTPALRLAAEGRRQIHPALVADRRSARPLFRPARGFQLARVVHGPATPAVREARENQRERK